MRNSNAERLFYYPLETNEDILTRFLLKKRDGAYVLEMCN